MVLTPDGRQAMRMETAFYGMPIRQSQIVQEKLDQLLVRLVPGEGYSQSHDQEIVNRLRHRVGNVRVQVERVDQVPRSANGKIRHVVSKLTPADREAILAGRPALAASA